MMRVSESVSESVHQKTEVGTPKKMDPTHFNPWYWHYWEVKKKDGNRLTAGSPVTIVEEVGRLPELQTTYEMGVRKECQTFWFYFLW